MIALPSRRNLAMMRMHTLLVPLLLLVTLCSGAGPWTLTPLAQPVRGVGYKEAVIVNGVIIFMQIGTDAGIKRWDDGNITTLVLGRKRKPRKSATTLWA